MKTHRCFHDLFLLVGALWTSVACGDVQRILVQTEIDDDHIVVVTEKGEQLLLEKWPLKFSPLIFEGKTFLAEVSPLWVTIHIEGKDPVKWSVQKSLGQVTRPPESKTKSENPHVAPKKKEGTACYKTTIHEPSPFNGSGGELIMLANGSIWKDSSYQYLYLYEYYPEVLICPSDGRMILREHVFQVTRIK